jgi:hypothetical protein
MQRWIQITREIEALNAELRTIQRECEHDWQPAGSDIECTHPVCNKCGSRGFGWYCQESPTRSCEYEEDEWCIHCGEPEERK